jgi:hypothetical protein
MKQAKLKEKHVGKTKEERKKERNVSFPEVKLTGHGVDHPPHLAPRLKNE